MTVPDVRVFDDAETPSELLPQLRALCDQAFDGHFSDHDWDHTFGGWRAVVVEDGRPLAHAAVVPRQLEVDKRPFRTGYVEAVAAQPDVHRNGFGTKVMGEIGRILHAEFEMGALSTAHWGFYERMGWERWRGPSYVREPSGLVRTADEDAGIMVLRFGASQDANLARSVSCEPRSGDDW